MTTNTEFTITRAQLQEICERIIQAVLSLTHEDQAALQRVAQIARTVVGDHTWWDPQLQCGCLVGTLLRGDPVTLHERDPGRASVLRRAGALYLRELFHVTGAPHLRELFWTYDEAWLSGPSPHVIPVIDP